MKKIKNYLLGVLTLTMLTTVVVSCTDNENYPPFSPTGNFSYKASEADALSIEFTTTGVTNAETIEWDFGDGENGTGAAVTHTYAADGEYPVVMTINGMSGSIPKVVSKTVVVRSLVVYKREGGIVIGHTGVWEDDSAFDIPDAFDGDFNTFVDANAANADKGYAGYDYGVGSSAVVTSVKFAPRSGFEGRMVGGEFRGTNDPNIIDNPDLVSDYDVLYTVTTAPAAGELTEVQISNTTGYRFIYYAAPVGGYGNVAELEFYGYFDLGVININNWTVQRGNGDPLDVTITDGAIHFESDTDWKQSHMFQEVTVEAGTYQLSATVTIGSVITNTWCELIFAPLEKEPVAGSDYAPGIPYEVVYSTWNGVPTTPDVYQLNDIKSNGEMQADGLYTFDAPKTFLIVIKTGAGATPYDLTYNHLSFRKVD